MMSNLKALIVILCLAWAVFFVAKPICLRYMTAQTFDRRRNVWFALTVVAFVSPAFWMYALVALVVLAWASSKDDNPLAIYVLVTFVVPNVRFFLPTLVINQLFDLTQYRILSFAVVLPALNRIRKQADGWGDAGLKPADIALMAFILLQLALNMPYETGTNTMRRGFLFVLDTFIVFYAFSRVPDQKRLEDVLCAFWLGCTIMVPIAVFEWGKGWLLYNELSLAWGDNSGGNYLYRASGLRAQAAALHSINLGYVLAMGLGIFFYMREKITYQRWVLPILLMTSWALFVTGSRGAWLTAALAVVVFVAMRPNAGRRLAGTLLVGVVLVAVMYVTPLKESVLDRLPIIGTADQDTIEYRQQLAELSWTLIRQNPFFGSPFVVSQMEEMRQGQGIIDIVNGYIFAALFNGLIGLFLFVTVFAIALWRGLLAWWRVRQVSSHDASLAASLVGLLIASLFYIGTAGYGTTSYIVAGLLLSYSTITVKRFAIRQQVWAKPIGSRLETR